MLLQLCWNSFHFSLPLRLRALARWCVAHAAFFCADAVLNELWRWSPLLLMGIKLAMFASTFAYCLPEDELESYRCLFFSTRATCGDLIRPWVC